MTHRRWTGLAIIAGFIILSLLPHPDAQSVDVSHPYAKPELGHILGTDNLGRDLHARMAEGLWRTLLVVLVASLLSLVIGVLIGLVAGYLGRWHGTYLVTAANLVLVVPTFIAALIISAVFGLTPITAGIALGVFGIGPFVNQTYSLVRSTRTEQFIHVETLMGTPVTVVLFRHVLPAVIRPVLAYLSSTCAAVTVAYAGLAFIGLGVDASTPDWGTMLYDYRVNVVTHPLLILWPTLGVLGIAFAFYAIFAPTRSVNR